MASTKHGHVDGIALSPKKYYEGCARSTDQMTQCNTFTKIILEIHTNISFVQIIKCVYFKKGQFCYH